MNLLINLEVSKNLLQNLKIDPTQIFAPIIPLMFLRTLEIISMGVANSVLQLLIRLIMIIIRSLDGYSPLFIYAEYFYYQHAST